MIPTRLYILLSIAIWTSIASCTDTVLEPEPCQQAGLPISFSDGSVDDLASRYDGQTDSTSSFEDLGVRCSRGQATTASNMQTFAVSATVYSSDGSRQLYFAHEKYDFSYLDQKVYITTEGKVHYWLSDDDEYNFFAYTPSPYIYFESGVVDKFIYTTPKNVVSQPDIVVATNIAAEYGQPVALNFTHPLAQVSFFMGPTIRSGRIKSITLTGIIQHGQFDMLTGEWMMSSYDTTSFVWNCDMRTRANANMSGEYYNFFFVPQQLAEDAMITIVFQNIAGGLEIHRSALNGTWQAGHRYRYTISL